MTTVLDAAYPTWTPASLQANGVTGVARYLSWLPNTKVITKAEYDGYQAAGIPVMLNWESTGRSWRSGYQAGLKEGAEARRQARALGHPDTRPIIQSIDENVAAGWIHIAVAYQRGFNDGGACGPQGAYSTTPVLAALVAVQLISVGWQTNARGWWGNGNDSPHASLIQHFSKSYPAFPPASYDESTVVGADWGQHPISGSTPGPSPIPVPPAQSGDDDVLCFEDDIHPGIDTTHPKIAFVNAQGDVILGNGASVGMPVTKLGALTVVPNDGPADHKYISSEKTEDKHGRCVGWTQWYVSADGQWHPRTRTFA